MIYNEVKMDLFDVESDYTLVHCISADFKMGMGIAKTFADLGCQKELFRKNPDYVDKWDSLSHSLWTKIPIREYKFPNGAFHLVTKKRYFEKPIYYSLEVALHDLRRNILMERLDVKLAMPKIGCGLDRLEWKEVQKIIFDVFEGTNIEILVCNLE